MFICLESGEELWLANIVVILIVLAIFHKGQTKDKWPHSDSNDQKRAKMKTQKESSRAFHNEISPPKIPTFKNFNKWYNFKKSRN